MTSDAEVTELLEDLTKVLNTSALTLDGLTGTYPDAELAAKQLRHLIEVVEAERAKKRPSRKAVQWMAAGLGAVILAVGGNLATGVAERAVFDQSQAGVVPELQRELAECMRIEREASRPRTHDAGGTIEGKGTLTGSGEVTPPPVTGSVDVTLEPFVSNAEANVRVTPGTATGTASQSGATVRVTPGTPTIAHDTTLQVDSLQHAQRVDEVELQVSGRNEPDDRSGSVTAHSGTQPSAVGTKDEPALINIPIEPAEVKLEAQPLDVQVGEPALLMEDGSSHLLLEDGSSRLLLEGGNE